VLLDRGVFARAIPRGVAEHLVAPLAHSHDSVASQRKRFLGRAALTRRETVRTAVVLVFLLFWLALAAIGLRRSRAPPCNATVMDARGGIRPQTIGKGWKEVGEFRVAALDDESRNGVALAPPAELADPVQERRLESGGRNESPRLVPPKRGTTARPGERARGASGAARATRAKKRDTAVNHDLAAAISSRRPAVRGSCGDNPPLPQVLASEPLFLRRRLASRSLDSSA